MHRRSFSTLAFATLAGTNIAGPGAAQNASSDLETQLQGFKGFPGTTSLRIDVGNDKFASKSPGRQLFVASTIKTFIICQYLRDVEAGRLSEDEQLSVDDNVRTESSPVLQNLTGTTPARSILEASITHSDNTATDIALLHVGPDRVRSFIAAEGLRATLVPDSTRRFFSYNVGAPLGVDIGWSGVQQVLALQQPVGPPRNCSTRFENGLPA
jgi:beta-lactamase class A